VTQSICIGMQKLLFNRNTVPLLIFETCDDIGKSKTRSGIEATDVKPKKTNHRIDKNKKDSLVAFEESVYYNSFH
jgi:hypothetical protein